MTKTNRFGVGSNKYVEQLHAVVSRHMDELKTHIQEEQFNPYSLRKGAATFASSGTTMGPSVPSNA